MWWTFYMQMFSVEDVSDLGNYIPAFSSGVAVVEDDDTGSSHRQYLRKYHKKLRKKR